MALIGGFFAFCATLPRAEELSAESVLADIPEDRGMIILTGGGGQRIQEGLALMQEGIATRAFISGVHPQTTKADISRWAPDRLLDCCVDLGPMARSTAGNARESRAWIERHRFSSVWLVTSDFHVPRATAELRAVAPELEIIPIPVASVFAPETGWMGRPSSWRLLGGEYLKYLFVCLRSYI